MKILLGLGSNLGERENNLEKAIFMLSPHLQAIKRSSLYENKAMLPENAPASWDIPFINLVVSGDTNLTAEEFLKLINDVEIQLGRVRDKKWEPRAIDIDILLYEDEFINKPDLMVPHIGLYKRDFFFRLAQQIEPDWMNRMKALLLAK